MITIGDKQYRNLQEQVRFNQENIEYLLKEGGTLNEFGIKVVGQVNTYNDLPAASSYTGEYGDAYAVGTSTPYTFYIFTRATAGQVGPFWFNIGQFPVPSTVPGPTGATGPQGPTGVRGSIWYSGNTNTPPSGSYFINDKYLNISNGNVYNWTNSGWILIGNIRGPQGVPGAQGQPGPAGAAGPIGPQGPKGDAGQSFTIAGTVASIDLLPAPTEENRTKGYLVGTDTYDLYVVVGTDTLTWKNLGRVEGVEGPQGPQGPQGIQGPNGYPIYSIDFEDEYFLEGHQRFDLSLSDFTPQDPAPVTNCIGVTKDGKMCTIGVQSDSEGYFITCYKSLIGPQGPIGPTGPSVPTTVEWIGKTGNLVYGINNNSKSPVVYLSELTANRINYYGWQPQLHVEGAEDLSFGYTVPLADSENIVRKKTSDENAVMFDLSDTYNQNHMTRSEITELINNIKTTSFKVVDALPETGEGNIIYLVPRTETEEQNIYDEYIWTGTAWEKISGSGGTAIDLSQYAPKNNPTIISALTVVGKKYPDSFIAFENVSSNISIGTVYYPQIRIGTSSGGQKFFFPGYAPNVTPDVVLAVRSDIGAEVTITDVPSTATQGTLTSAQLSSLQANDASYILFNNEKYYLQDKGHTEGFLTYTHCGFENSTFTLKAITVTIATRAWVLNSKTIA